jgi:hypothetical protein
VEAKFKTENAKPGKHGRLYITYGRSILYSGWVYEFVKMMLCQEHDITDMLRDFFAQYEDRWQSWSHKPEPNISADAISTATYKIDLVKALDEDFDFDAHVPKHGLYTRCFSDDNSSVYTTQSGEILMFDTDISSCDAGNTFAMFYILALFMRAVSFGMYIRTNFSRLKEKITIRNPSNPREVLVVQPITMFEGSGCPETTVVNFIASYLIYISTCIHIIHANTLGDGFDDADEDQRTLVIKAAAEAVGHVVTVVWCETPADTQFLKYSPLIRTTGRRVNCRNLGAVLRGLGTNMTDFSPKSLNLSRSEFRKMSMQDKYERYIRGVVGGLVNEPSNIIIDALRARFPSTSSPKTALAFNEDTSKRSHYSIPTESLIDRYGGSEMEWETLATQIETAQYGIVRFAPIVDLIFAKDYGL